LHHRPLALPGGFLFFKEKEGDMNGTRISIRKILLAVDGSEHSHVAVLTVRDLTQICAKDLDCQVIVLSVLPSLEAPNHAAFSYPLNQAQKILKENGIQASADLVLGYPADVILNYATANQPDLIVLGAKGLRATLGILLGGVAQQVVENACCPVLVIRAPYRKIRNVLIVTDGSEYSRDAVEFAVNFQFISEANFHLLHVLPPSPLLTPDTITRVWNLGDEPLYLPVFTQEELDAEAEASQKAGKAILNEANQSLLAHNIQAKNILLRGDAATEILQYALDHQIDLIFAGSRGLGQVQSWLIGSVSRKLVHYGKCSVLLVKRPHDT